jgi:baculoviral IAP repeat-containing protein 6
MLISGCSLQAATPPIPQPTHPARRPKIAGKVCLSLLGTWHGGHESEKWNPAASTLYQVLLSIQGMIFVEDPYFNEPAYEGMRGTAEGAAASLRYNSELRLNTLRHAMADVLRKPRPGYEEVTRAHFRLLRHRILRTAAAWVAEAAPLEAGFRRKMRGAVAELRELLAAL